MPRHRYEQIAEELYQEIESGRLAPGARLPSTHRLEARFGVSRMTIRHAIERLRALGLVDSQRGRGVFVLGPPAELPVPRQEHDPDRPLIQRLDTLEAHVREDLAEIRDRLDSIEARLD